MLHRQRAIQALERKREKFRQFIQLREEDRRQLAGLLEKFQGMSRAQVEDALNQQADPLPGALPTDELDQAQAMRLPFPERWNNHREARRWALATLYKRPVIAVDGSQITPTKDFSMPVGAVQIGWFINEHQEAKPGAPPAYIKDVSFDVLAPDELDDDDENPGDFPNWRVNQERFVRECDKLCQLMQAYQERPQEERPLCFFDGSFIVSFAGQLRPDRARPYLNAVQRLLDCSQSTRTPLVGFVDSPHSRDLVTLLHTLFPQTDLRAVSDARLLQSLLPNWGDRSPAFICARPDSLSKEGRAPFYKEVCFTYLRLVSDRPPARLELPRWILESGQLEAVVDRVRAECVVGMGYPYAIETADAVAVLTAQDRERFYRLFQQFLEREGVRLSAARKMRSKRSRR